MFHSNSKNTICKDLPSHTDGDGPCLMMGQIRFPYQAPQAHHELRCNRDMLDCGWAGELDLSKHTMILADPKQKREAAWWIVFSLDLKKRGLAKPEYLQQLAHSTADLERLIMDAKAQPVANVPDAAEDSTDESPAVDTAPINIPWFNYVRA